MLRRAATLFLATCALIGGGIAVDGWTSGWTRLAGRYPAPDDGSTMQVTVQEGGLGAPRWYHRVAPLQVSVGLGGLRLGYPFPYSVAHRPLEIPWSALSLEGASLGPEGSAIRLAVSGPEPAIVSLRGDLAAVVREWLAPRR